MFPELIPILERLTSVIAGVITTKMISGSENESDIIHVNIELTGDKLMSIIANLQLIVSVMKEVDVVMGALPQNPEIVALKSKLDEALSVIQALGL